MVWRGIRRVLKREHRPIIRGLRRAMEERRRVWMEIRERIRVLKKRTRRVLERVKIRKAKKSSKAWKERMMD